MVCVVAESFDLFVRPGFLCTEIICWKSKNLKAFVFVRHIKAFKVFVLRGISAERCNVDNKQHIAFVIGERFVFTVDSFHRERIQWGHRAFLRSLCCGGNCYKNKYCNELYHLISSLSFVEWLGLYSPEQFAAVIRFREVALLHRTVRPLFLHQRRINTDSSQA